MDGDWNPEDCKCVEREQIRKLCDEHDALVRDPKWEWVARGYALNVEMVKLGEQWLKNCKCFVKKSGRPKTQGVFAFTLTCSPSDNLTQSDMITAVNKVMKQKSEPVKKFAWYVENKGVTAEGEPRHPHIHGMYETESGRKIEDKHWKRAWKVWNPKVKLGQGFRGGYHRPVNAGEAYSDYIKKDGGLGEASPT